MELSVLTAYLVDKLGTIKGRKAYQKLVYMAKAVGVPINESYRMHLYGPFSQQVADKLDIYMREDILTQSGYSCLKSGEKKNEILDKNHDLIDKCQTQLENLVEWFGKRRPLELEILATTHYIYITQKNIYGVTDKSCIIDEIKKAKYPKFSMDQINKAYDELESYKLLN